MDASWWFRRLVIVAAATLTHCGGAEGRYVEVGGEKKRWIPYFDYTIWVTWYRYFYVGDKLVFDYNVHLYDVLEVSKTSYEQCSTKGLIHNVTRTGRDVFELKEARAYYFICGKEDYCSEGMKVAVTAKQPRPPPPSHRRGGAHRSGVTSLMLGFFVVLVWLFAM